MLSRSAHPPPHRSPLHLVVLVCQRLQVQQGLIVKDLIVLSSSFKRCSQAGDLYHHSHPYPCLPQKRHRRPSPVSTRMNTLCIPVSTVLFTMMCSVSLIVSLSSISCIHHHSSSAEKRCPSAQCRALSLLLSRYLQMARRYLLDRSSVHHCSVTKSPV